MHHRGKVIFLPPNRVWRTYPGGRTLDTLAKVPAPADTHLAEDWIASTTRAVNRGREHLAEGVSQVCVGDDPVRHDFALTLFNLAPLTSTDLATRVRCSPRRLRELGPRSHQDELIGPAETDCFRVTRTTLRSPVVKDENSAVIAIVTRGVVTASVGGISHRLDTYDKFFLPARLGPVTFTPEPETEILECHPPS